MALIFLDSSICPLCGKVLTAGEEIIGLPSISDNTHKLYQFFDNGFHQSCFANWEFKEEVANILREEEAKFKDSANFKEMESKYGGFRSKSNKG